METVDFIGIKDMSMNDEQAKINPTTALKSFSSFMISAKASRYWFLSKLHPDGAYCPHCNRKLTGERAIKSFWDGRRTWCKSCQKQFYATTDTVLNNTELNFQKLYLLLVLSALGIQEKIIAEILNIHPDTVKKWQRKLK